MNIILQAEVTDIGYISAEPHTSLYTQVIVNGKHYEKQGNSYGAIRCFLLFIGGEKKNYTH